MSNGSNLTYFDKLITIIQNALDCSTSLADGGFTDPAAITYNSAGSSLAVTADFTGIFTHSQTTDCPLTQCHLRESTDCTVALAAQSNVAMTASPSFGLTQSETVALGYIQPFCFRCGILPAGQSEIFFDKTITLTANALDCSTSLADGGFINPAAINYNSAGSSLVVTTDFTGIFTHS